MTRILSIVFFLAISFPATAANFFIDTAANGCNNGHSGSGPGANSWCDPNHTGTAGADTFWVVPGNYAGAQWVTGTCTGAAKSTTGFPFDSSKACNLYCGNGARTTLNSCTFSATGSTASIRISSSGWDVQGFNVNSTLGACIELFPDGATTVINWRIKNNVITNCLGNGVAVHFNGSNGSWDYGVVESNYVYNSGGGFVGVQCNSGISLYWPFNFDAAPGVHVVIAKNFVNSSLNVNGCLTTNTTTDGDGITLDTWGTAGGSYTSLALVESNLLINNGGPCLQPTWINTNPVIWRNNTCWQNNVDPHSFPVTEGAIAGAQAGLYGQFYNNLVLQTSATCCNGPQNLFAVCANFSQTIPWQTNLYNYNNGRGVSSQNFSQCNGATFSFNATNTTLDPQFAGVAIPSSPTCATFADVPSCLIGTGVIANFTPTNAAVHLIGNDFFCALTDIVGTAKPVVGCNPGAINW